MLRPDRFGTIYANNYITMEMYGEGGLTWTGAGVA